MKVYVLTSNSSGNQIELVLEAVSTFAGEQRALGLFSNFLPAVFLSF